jgi:hypothetical protein
VQPQPSAAGQLAARLRAQLEARDAALCYLARSQAVEGLREVQPAEERGELRAFANCLICKLGSRRVAALPFLWSLYMYCHPL